MALERVVLTAPVNLSSGQVLANKEFIVGPAFIESGASAVIYGGNIEAPVIRNCKIVGPATWPPGWNAGTPFQQPGPSWNMAGIRLQVVPNATIEHVTIEGMSRTGITGHGIGGLRIYDALIRRCFAGIAVGDTLTPTAGDDITLERVTVHDLWGPADGYPVAWPGIWNQPSIIDPSHMMGADGIVVSQATNVYMADCLIFGEMWGGFKAVNVQGMEVHRMCTNHGMVQGWTYTDNSLNQEPASDILFRNCLFHKAFGVGTYYPHPNYGLNNPTSGGNGFQLSWGIEDVLFEQCSFDGYGFGGHGVEINAATGGDQAEREVHATFRGCSFSNFNLQRGSGDAVALQVNSPGSTVNADFEAVNTFRRQLRIR